MRGLVRRHLLVPFLVLGLWPLPLHAAGSERDEKEKGAALSGFARRLDALDSNPDLSEEQVFLHARAAELLDRARQAPAGSFLLDRLRSALDGLLDASREIERVRRPSEEEAENDSEPEARRRTARALERAYLLIQQGGYFGRKSGEATAEESVRRARRLYQQGRSAFDAGRYWRALRYADAVREIIHSLEHLAQAAVRVPEPPPLEGR